MHAMRATVRRSLRRLDSFLPALCLPPQHRLQKLPGVAARRLHDILRRALGDDLAAAIAAFGAEVDDPVGGLDDFEIVLDDDDRVAVVDEAVEHFEQLRKVVEVEAGRGFVEEVERLAGVGPSKLGR